ncbi:MAG: polymer-forming cytoskeletal protein [Anaerolineae bacterium]
MQRILRRSFLIVTLLLAIAFIAPTSHAAEFRSGPSAIVAEGETINDDVYLSGSLIAVNGTVKGDVVAWGQEIVVNGTITGNLNAAGATVTINGTIGGTVRAAGYSVVVGPGAKIGRDLVAAGYNIEVAPGSQIAGDAVLASSQAVVGGTVGRNYLGTHNAAEINGTVKQNVTLQVGASQDNPVDPAQFMPRGMAPRAAIRRIAPGLTLGSAAQVGGTLNYTSPVDAQIAPGAQVAGGAQRREPEETTRQRQQQQQAAAEAASPLTFAVRLLTELVTLLLVGLVMMALFPGFMHRAALALVRRPLVSLGWSLVAIIAVPILILFVAGVALLVAIVLGVAQLGSLGAFTFVGSLLGLGAVILGFWAILTWLSKIIIGLALGRWLLSRSAHLAESRYWPLLLGVTVLTLLVGLSAFVPYFGPFVIAVITLFGTGAAVVALWQGWRGRGAAPTAVTPAPPSAPPSPLVGEGAGG